MRIRERHLNGAFIDLQLPDSSGWNVAEMLKDWRDFNDRYVTVTPEEPEREALPMGFTVMTVKSDHEPAE